MNKNDDIQMFELDKELGIFLLDFFTTALNAFNKKWGEKMPDKHLPNGLKVLVAVTPFVAYYQYRVDILSGLHSDGELRPGNIESIASLADTVKKFKQTFEEYAATAREMGY